MYVSQTVLDEFRRIVEESQVVGEDDKDWPEPDRVGKQELEVRMGNDHIRFTCSKIGSLLDVQDSKDPEGLKIFYYLVQDLRCLLFSLIGLHFKVRSERRVEVMEGMIGEAVCYVDTAGMATSH